MSTNSNENNNDSNPTSESTIKELAEYLKSKNYKMIDITTLLNVETYEKYATIAKLKPNVILYFKRNNENNMLFEAINAVEKCNYFFINKDNYLTDCVTNILDNNLKRCIVKFLLDKETEECNICFNNNMQFTHCNTCFYRMCSECILKMMAKDLTKDEIINQTNSLECPHCNTIITDLIFKETKE